MEFGLFIMPFVTTWIKQVNAKQKVKRRKTNDLTNLWEEEKAKWRGRENKTEFFCYDYWVGLMDYSIVGLFNIVGTSLAIIYLIKLSN